MGRDKCHTALQRIYPYLDAEVTVYRRLIIRRHLRQCRNCTGAFSFEEQLQIVIRERSHQDPPPEFLDRLRSAIQDLG
jgi:mycothiol system anti-sigma-R factor